MKGFFRLLAIIAVAAIVSFLVAHLGYPVNYSAGYTDSSKSAFVDQTGIFTEKEVADINARVKQVSEKAKLNIMIIANTQYFATDWDTEVFADDKYDEIFGEDSDGLLYTMDFAGKSNSYDYLSLSGRACLLFSDVMQYMVDSAGDRLPYSSQVIANGLMTYKENVADAVNYFLDLVSGYSDGKKEASYVHTTNGKYIFRSLGKLYVTHSKPPFIRFRILLIGEVAGAIVGLIMYYAIKSKYKFKAAADPCIYLNRSDVHFYTRTDAFLRSHTSRYNISSGGGSGGGGGGGGGRPHGGGGHSFSGGHIGAGHHR